MRVALAVEIASVTRARDDDEPDDGALVAAAQAGDTEAFAALYSRWGRAVHAAALARVPAADAGDLVQDTFVIALRRLSTLRDGAAFGGWVLMIARNRATDHHRRTRPVVPLDADIGRPAPPAAEAAEVLAAIRELPEAYREPLLLRLVEGMSGPEIAEQTGLAAGSVRVNLCRGMALLRKKLGWSQDDES